MVLLKRLLLISSVCLVQLTYAQTVTEQRQAFSKSYSFEADSNYTQAIAAIKQVYVESSYEVNLRLGWLYYKSGDYNNSVKYYKSAIKILPYSEEAKQGIVYPLAELGQWGEVENMYKNILQIHPQNTLVLYKISLLYYNQAKYFEASEYLKTLSDLYPFDYDAMVLYAWTNYMLGKTKEAKLLFNKVLLYSPTDKSALEGLKLLE